MTVNPTALWVCLGALGCGRLGVSPPTDDGAVAPVDAPDPVDADVQVPGDAQLLPACDPLETAGPYTTDFALGVPTWATFYEIPPARLDVESGSLRGRPGVAGGTVYAGLELPVGDYRSRRVFVQVPTMVNTAGCAQVSLAIQDDDVVDEYIEIAQSCGVTEVFRWSGPTPTSIASLPYDPVAHRWWQLRMETGVVHAEVSPDGLAWTELGTIAIPSYFDDVYVELSAGTYELETAPIGEARFDDLMDCLVPDGTAVVAPPP